MLTKFDKINFRHTALTLSLSFVVGVLAAFSAFLFRSLLAFFHNLFFFGHFSFVYNETIHTNPSLWGIGIILIPAIGGLFVIGLIERFAYDERGLSVPEIMYKTRHSKEKICPKISLAKTLAAAISIGSGASVGREGPIVQMSAAISSFLENVIALTVEQRTILIAAGAAAGTAAIFNAPLAGIAFAIELLLTSIDVVAITSIMIAALVAYCIQYLIIGNTSIFIIQMTHHINNYPSLLINLVLFIIFGIIIGIMSTLFIRSIYWFEDAFSWLFTNRYLRHTVGMFIVGIMLYIFMRLFGHYYIEGIGYSTIQDILNALITNPWLLLCLALGKLLVTCLSLGTGASGGVFSPALFLGAALGVLFGLLFNYFFPNIAINPVLFAMIGMAAMVGSATGAIITAILLTLEMTRDYYAIFPLIITTVIAYVVRKKICRDSVYTLKLTRRGCYIS